MADDIPYVAPAPLPTPYDDTRATPDAFGAAVGDVVQQGAGMIDDLAKRAKTDADTTAVIGAIGTAKGALNNIILDPQSGYVAQKGTDAIAKRDDFLNKFDAAVGQAESSLTNDDQRRAFEKHALDVREEGARHVYAHEAAQMEDVSKAAFAGAADQTIQAMQSSIGAPDLDANLATLKQLATAEGARRFPGNPAAIQSVVVPVMQKAAIDTMEAAASSGNPSAAKAALDTVAPYLLNHEQHYTQLVGAMAQKQQVNSQAAQAISGSVTQVLMPGGTSIPRLDATNLATTVLKLPDAANKDDVVKAIEQRQTILDKVWSQSVAQQVSSAQTAGTDPVTGAFSIDRVPVATKLWLQQNAPDKLIALRTLDTRAQRQDSGEAKQISRENYNTLTVETTDQTLRKSKFAQMSPDEFLSYIRDDDKFPGGFTLQDEQRAQQQFSKIKSAATKLEEPIPSAVNEILKSVFPVDPQGIKSKPYIGSLHDQLQAFVDDYESRHKGVAPSSAEVREYGAKEFAKGNVDGTGLIFRDTVPLIDFQTKPKYAGHRFVPLDETAQPITRGAAAPAAAPAATTPRTVRSYRYTADRKQRAPIYSDGTQGALEAAP